MRSFGLALLTATAIAALPAGATAQSGPLGLSAQSDRLDLPVVAIDAPEGIVDDPKRPGTMRVFDRNRREDDSGRIGIELRGGTSQTHSPKKSYALETRTRSGKNRNVSLLGMPKEDDWVLIANYIDESLLRNYVAYSTARWMGRYASRTRLVELNVNGSYEGVYLLGEKLKLHDSRVAVDDSDISGGYLLEMTSMQRMDRTPQVEEFFTTAAQNRPVMYADPDRDELSKRQARWIRRYVSRFERRLYSDRFRHRRRGYRRYLDMGAAVDYALFSELFSHVNTFADSTYMHKGVGEKLVLGPIWDFDNGIGNGATAEFNLRTGWRYGAYPWAGRLYADPAFRRRMARRWRELRRQGLRRRIMRTVDRGTRQLAGGPQQRNFSRWPIFERDRDRQPPDPRTGEFPANHAEAVDYLKWWLKKRTRWIDRNIKGFRP